MAILFLFGVLKMLNGVIEVGGKDLPVVFNGDKITINGFDIEISNHYSCELFEVYKIKDGNYEFVEGFHDLIDAILKCANS